MLTINYVIYCELSICPERIKEPVDGLSTTVIERAADMRSCPRQLTNVTNLIIRDHRHRHFGFSGVGKPYHDADGVTHLQLPV